MDNRDRIFINRTAIRVIHSLFIGCGGKGTEAVEHCRNLAEQELFNGSRKNLYDFPSLQFRALDSAKQDIASKGKDHDIPTIAIASDQIEEVIFDKNFPPAGNGPLSIRSKMPRRNYKRMLNSLPGASMGNSTCPPLGAMNFLASWESTRKELKVALDKWKQHAGGHEIETFPLGKLNQIFIVSSLYGGTGSGAHIHLAAMLRSILKDSELQIKNTAIYGIFFLPDIVHNADHAGRRKLKANTYACLKELDYFLSGNPYTLELGTGVLEISNTATDHLFNKVFLVNDRNSEGVTLGDDEAADMIGEFLFHFAATTLGESINARLVDTPTERCQQMAPEEKQGEFGPDRRICSYSTFGLATIRIPYEVLRHNLTVDFACEIMNELLLHPDDETPEEHRKIKEKKEKLMNRFAPNKLLTELNLTKEDLRKRFQPAPPDFLRYQKIEDYMKNKDHSDPNTAFDQIRTEIERKALKPDESEDAASFEQDISTKLEVEKDKILDMGGPRLCRNVLSAVRTGVKEMRKEYSEMRQEDAPDSLKKQIKSMDEFIIRNRGKRFFKSKGIKRLNQSLPSIKRHVSNCMMLQLAEKVIPGLEEVERLITGVLDNLQRDVRGYNKILEVISQMELPYQQSNLLLNAVAPDLLFEFIRKYDYPAGARPEDIAEKIKTGKLEVYTRGPDKSFEVEKVAVSDFPDKIPEEVAKAIFRLAKTQIDELGESQWKKSFEKSGLYPRFGIEAVEEIKDVEPKINAFTITQELLNKHSTPYLEYQAGEGFSECRETFLIHPTLIEGDTDIEKLRWAKREPWPLGRQLPVEGDVETLPAAFYSLTSLQMHYGIPLYSIDEIEDWKNDYEYMLKNTDRPLHKFRARMKEPYINIAKSGNLTPSEISQVFDWAIRTSRDEYPIFFMHDELPILDMMENDIVRTTYFRLFDEGYLELDRVKELLKKEESLTDYLFREIKLVNSQIKGRAPLDEYFVYYQGEDTARVVTRLLEKLADMDNLENTSIKFKKTSTSTGVFISPEGVVEDPMLKELLTRHFLKELPTPVLKEGLTEKFVKERLMNAPSFLECFLSKCSEAYEHLLMLGKSEGDFPVALREK